MRSRIRAILRSLCDLYLPSKLFNYIQEIGLKSKNSRTRSESLDELGGLIQRYGVNVCVPTKSFPVIAVHIGDRDSSVRNAAINALLQAYLLTDEIVFKQIGRLSEKDKSMLQEKFRRAKPPPAPEPEAEEETVVKFSFQKKLQQQVSEDVHHERNGHHVDVEEPFPVVEPDIPPAKPHASATTGLRRPLLNSGKFGLPPPTRITQTMAAEPPAPSEEVGLANYPNIVEPQHQPERMPPAQPRSFAYRGGANAASLPQVRAPQHNPSKNKGIDRDALCAAIDNGDSIRSIVALKQLESYLASDPSSLFPYVNNIVRSITLKSHLAMTQAETPEQVKLCKHLVNCLVQIFSVVDLALSVSLESLSPCIQELLVRMLDQHLQSWDSGPQIVRALNMLMMRIIDNANKNDNFTYVFHLFYDNSISVRAFAVHFLLFFLRLQVSRCSSLVELF